MRFGLPSVAGIKTATVWEHLQSGESEAEIAADFGMSERDVRWAAAYENSAHAAA
jgi:uncharacterized protein (DUF433 family)